MADDQVTHYPQRNGTVCGKFPPPTDARDYDPNNPTCEKCKAWLNAAQANTTRIMQRAAAAGKQAAAAAATEEPPTTGKARRTES